MTDDLSVTVNNPQEIAKRLAKLTDSWAEIASKALGEALSMDEVLGEIKRRTPRSELDSEWNLYADGTRIRDRSNPGRDGYTPGMNNLRNDLKLQPVTEGNARRSYNLGFNNVAYAGHVHEMNNDTTHWTHAGTGSQFLAGVIEEQQDHIPQVMCENIAHMLKEAGVI